MIIEFLKKYELYQMCLILMFMGSGFYRTKISLIAEYFFNALDKKAALINWGLAQTIVIIIINY